MPMLHSTSNEQPSSQSPLCPPAQAWMHALRGFVDTPLGGHDARRISARTVAPKHQPAIGGTGAVLLGPILLSCVCALRQWPKFMIACICAPGRIMHADQPPNESSPCDTAAAVCGLECALLLSFCYASDDGTAASSSQRIADLVAAMHSLTHSSQPAFTSPPFARSPDSASTHTGTGSGTGTHEASYRRASRVAADAPSRLEVLRHSTGIAACPRRGRTVPISTRTPSLNSALWRRLDTSTT
ncbi:hypothetical protein V8C35DRAFT_310422 [Trichoderma chlorosporum]